MITRSALAGALAIAAFLLIPATAAGLPAVAVTLVAGAAWCVVLLRRLEPSLGLSGIVIGWMTVTFLVTSLAPLVHAPLSLTRELVYAVTAAIAWALERARPTERETLDPIRPAAWAASLLGPLAWIVGIFLGAVLPNGSGLSWAAHADAGSEVWMIRVIGLQGGVPSGTSSMSRPLEQTLSASFLPFEHTVDGSSRALREELLANATAWSVLIVLSCLLAGLVVAEFASRAGRAPAAIAAASGIVSLGMLTMPITGRMLDFGQINAHLVLVLLFASVLIARRAAMRPAASVSLLIIAMCLLLLSWTPFAAAPGLLALVAAWRSRSRLRQRTLGSVAWFGAAALVFTWTMSAYTARYMVSILVAMTRHFDAPSTNGNPLIVPVFSGIRNPYWLPFTVIVVAALLGAALAVFRLDRSVATVAVSILLGLLLGAAPLVATAGGLAGQLEYFPAKYISLATIAAIPVLIGVALRVILDPDASARLRSVATIPLVATMVSVAYAPVDIVPDRALFAPVALATGQRVGTHADLAGRALALTDVSVLRVAWRLDPRFDFAVGWLQSVALPMDPPIWDTPIRAAMRLHGDDFGASAACDLVRASDRPVDFVTADPNLAHELKAVCTPVTYTVTLVDAPRD